MQRSLPFATLDLPESWEDHTAFHYVSPAPSELAAPLAGARPGGVSAPRLTVIVAPLPLGAFTLDYAIEQQRAFYRASLPELSSECVEHWTHPLHGDVPVLSLTCAGAAGQSVHQLHAYFHQPRSNRAIVLTVSCDVRELARHEAEIARIFTSTSVSDRGERR